MINLILILIILSFNKLVIGLTCSEETDFLKGKIKTMVANMENMKIDEISWNNRIQILNEEIVGRDLEIKHLRSNLLFKEDKYVIIVGKKTDEILYLKEENRFLLESISNITSKYEKCIISGKIYNKDLSNLEDESIDLNKQIEELKKHSRRLRRTVLKKKRLLKNCTAINKKKKNIRKLKRN